MFLLINKSFFFSSFIILRSKCPAMKIYKINKRLNL